MTRFRARPAIGTLQCKKQSKLGKESYRHRLPEPALEQTQKFIEALEDAGFEVLKKTLRLAWWEEKGNGS